MRNDIDSPQKEVAAMILTVMEGVKSTELWCLVDEASRRAI